MSGLPLAAGLVAEAPDLNPEPLHHYNIPVQSDLPYFAHSEKTSLPGANQG